MVVHNNRSEDCVQLPRLFIDIADECCCFGTSFRAVKADSRSLPAVMYEFVSTDPEVFKVAEKCFGYCETPTKLLYGLSQHLPVLASVNPIGYVDPWF